MHILTYQWVVNGTVIPYIPLHYHYIDIMIILLVYTAAQNCVNICGTVTALQSLSHHGITLLVIGCYTADHE